MPQREQSKYELLFLPRLTMGTHAKLHSYGIFAVHGSLWMVLLFSKYVPEMHGESRVAPVTL